MADGGEAGRMRAGVRARVLGAARRTGGGLRALTPAAVVGLLCAGAFGPVLAVPGVLGVGGAAAIAGIGVLGSVGANVLTDVLLRALRGVRDRGGQGQDEIEAEVAAVVEQVLADGGPVADRLRAEVSAVLREIGGVGAALEAAVLSADRQVQVQVASAFGALGAEFAEFGFVLVDVRSAAASIQEALRRQDVERRADRERSLEQSTQLRLLREELSVVERRTRPRGDAGTGAVELWSAGPPYRGLWPFERDQEAVYYGRERLTAELVGFVGERLSGLGLVVVTGASGVGKSSLLRAGLLPAVARGLLTPGSESWPCLVMTPTATPLDELATRLAVLAGSDVTAVRAAVAEHPEQAHLLARQAVLAAAPRGRLVLVVDQFEELFTLSADGATGAATEAFLTALLAVAGTAVGATGQPAGLVVLGVRGDHWDRLAALPRLAEALQDNQFVVGPMTEAELRRAITGPAAAAGLELEDGLTATVLDELRTLGHPAGFEVGALPLLSQAMLVTWLHREGNRLTIRGYGRTGGLAHAVATSAEDAYGRLTPAGRALAEAVCRRLVLVTPSGEPARRTVTRGHLRAVLPGASDDLDAVLEALAAHRLLILDGDSVDLAHDVLLHGWPRLRDWLAADRADGLLYGGLVQDTSRWLDGGRDPSFLYRGVELAVLRQAVARWDADPGRHPTPDQDARAFLEAGARAGRRAAGWRRAALALLVVLLVAAGASAVVATDNAAEARHQRDVALSRQLVGQSEVAAVTDTALARRLALAAWRVSPTPEARYAMRTLLAGPQRLVLTGHTASVMDLAFTRDGRLVTAGFDGLTQRWELGGGRPARVLDGAELDAGPLLGLAVSQDGDVTAGVDVDGRLWTAGATGARPVEAHTGAARDVAFSPDGATMATVGDDGLVKLWETATGSPVGEPFTGHTDQVNGVAFGPDGTVLATAGADGTVRLWDVAGHRPLGDPLLGHTGAVNGVAFGPDGTRLATVGDDRTVRLWDVAARRPLGDPLSGHTQAVVALAFGADGTLATGGEDATVRRWDVGTGRPLGEPLVGHANTVIALAFGPDGTTLASGSSDETVRLWIPAPPAHRHGVEADPSESPLAVALAPDGRTVATSGLDGRVRRWDADTRALLGAASSVHHTDWVDEIAYSPDGTMLATAGRDGSARLWSSATGEPVGLPLVADTTDGYGTVEGIAFSPDGAVLATAGRDGQVRLWEVGSRRPLGSWLADPGGAVRDVAFSPDGMVAATGGDDGTVRLWDVATRQQRGDALVGHRSAVVTVAFSPDGRTVASGGDDNTIRFWDVAAGHQLGNPLAGHSDTVMRTAFTADGTTLVSAGYDGTLRLWDVAVRRQLGEPLGGLDTGLFDVAIGPDGRSMVTVGLDGVVRYWRADLPDDPASAVCATAGSLSEQEWSRYAAGQPMPPGCG